MNGSHSRHTLPADKMLSVERSRKGTPIDWQPSPAQMQQAKKFHTRKSRSYAKQQIRETLNAE